MKKISRIIAGLLALTVLAIWLAGGAHTGWTRTYVIVKTKDPVTEIEGVEEKKQFTPGVDFLGAGLVLSAGLDVASFFFRTKRPGS